MIFEVLSCNNCSWYSSNTFVKLCFLQVQLLVSNQDVDNYKQIKADLDQLRLTVEKSELWVEKNNSYESGELGEGQVKGGDEPIEVCLLAFICASCMGLINRVSAQHSFQQE